MSEQLEAGACAEAAAASFQFHVIYKSLVPWLN